MNDTIPGLEEQQLVMERVVPKNDDLLSQITRFAKKLSLLNEQFDAKESELKRLADQIKDIREKTLPGLMASVGLTEFVADGVRYGIKQEYYASIPKARTAEAMKWLREHNMGGVIKEAVYVSPSDKPTLEQHGITFHSEEAVHPSTLKALVREQLEANNPFPKDLFGVFVATTAVVK